ncbi:MAG: histidine kinase [Bauldia sp.]|nr:histidine kinase [Bauldia sp.]
MRFNSLAVRLVAISALWTAVAVVVAGIILSSLYRQSAERGFDERITSYSEALIGAFSEEGSALADPGDLGEPRFETIASGWYWQLSQDGRVVLTSRSLLLQSIEPPPAAESDASGVRRFAMTGPAGELLRGVVRPVSFPNLPGSFELVVAGNATELQGDIASFRTSVIVTLGVFALVLILSTFIMVRWGLRPLDRVRRGLHDIRSGQAARFDGNYPAEIAPLARELNALLDSNQQIVERARTQVGNLAHALKTPLSVITNEARADSSPLAKKVSEQAELMTRQVTHYLDRARIAASSQALGAITPVQPVVSRFVRAMRKIYEDKKIHISCDVAEGSKFRGEQQDLEEIIGNLTDNACKYAPGKVLITVRPQKPVNSADCAKLVFFIDDDGPGLTPEQATEATRRGKRLDESKPGSGLGLSIVTDLVALYKGTFRLTDAPNGGLRAEVTLPAAEA